MGNIPMVEEIEKEELKKKKVWCQKKGYDCLTNCISEVMKTNCPLSPEYGREKKRMIN
jgi:hypothetical protein